ncbi:hypothetical protein EDC04DRAFT_2609799 [Pisolithus marmoratus]|nr:hypothetical protein EDC04DRAFT_2609799 [Pisolithus marmoratus]
MLLCTGLQANISMRSPLTGFSVTPDLALVTNLLTEVSDTLFAIVECTFSQDCDDLMKKVWCEVEGWPQIVLVIVILISENRPYCSPKEGTKTWSFFSKLDISFLKEGFLALPQSIEACTAMLNKHTSTSGSCSIDKPNSPMQLDPSTSTEQSELTEAETDTDTEAEPKPQPVEFKPITVTGHMWCDIRDVQYHVWTKEDGAKRINLDDSKRFIYPHIEMEEAEWAIRKGLNAVKQGISKLLSISTSKSAVHRLQAADLRAHFDWRVIQARVMASSWVTTLSCYEDWHFNTFHGTKHAHLDDDKYQPMESLIHVIPALVCTWSIFTETEAPGGRGHPAHAHCLLQHYCDNDSGEFIDIEQELSDVGDENHERQENVQPQATAIHTASTDPLATGNSCQGQSRMNITHDINHFFRRKFGREKVYLSVISSKYLMATFERGYTFNMLREALNHAGTEISHLLPPPPPGVDNRVPVGKLPKGDLSIDLPKFSIQGLHEFLVDFIVSNDQDTDIPHHTKTHELILQRWQEHFMQLRVELKRAIGMISFTADIWSADKLDSYLVMMAHWIRHESGGMQPHSGKEIAKAILHLIDRAEIPVEKTWGNSPRILKSTEYITAVQEDPIHHGWETVQCVHNLGQRQHNFQQTIESGNANQSFMHGGVPSPLPVVQLLCT